VKACRVKGKRLLVTTSELTSREEAQSLGGAWIYLPRRVLPPPEEGEYYWFQLQGAEVSTVAGIRLGRVKALVDTGPYDLLVVADDQGREALIPVISQMVPVLDPEAGRVVVDLPEGLLESQGWPEENPSTAERPKEP
jgi:16S rRNA processing protein RimM